MYFQHQHQPPCFGLECSLIRNNQPIMYSGYVDMHQQELPFEDCNVLTPTRITILTLNVNIDGHVTNLTLIDY